MILLKPNLSLDKRGKNIYIEREKDRERKREKERGERERGY